MNGMQKARVHSLLTDYDIGLFQTGKHFRLYEKLGAHAIEIDGVEGMHFAVFAPAAETVFVEGDFSRWVGIELNVRWDTSGIWEGFIPGAEVGHAYKFVIHSKLTPNKLEKADPFASYAEKPPHTASVLWQSKHSWSDKQWMKKRKKKNSLDHPISIYEMHLGSWRAHEDGTSYTYLDLAKELPEYINQLGFSHVELMPVMEHPYDPSWGYQITGFFAPTSRFGTPDEFRVLIQALHKADIGVILDWVPSHFPSDAHGLGRFDGSCIYEHPDYRKGYHPDWDSLIFNYEKPEVRAFLISNALYWLDEFHIDGFRVDAVASMLYLDYSREDGAWEPNIYGGNENLDAISFLKELNETVYSEFPDTLMIAEESTAFAGVSHPTYSGGLGFGMKWMMGWMHDTLDYFAKPTVYRKFHHGSMSFSIVYAFAENFVLPFSHDEVVHGKASLLHKMPGDDWQKFANLRLLYGYMFAHPGAKLLFMGAELAQRSEWNFTAQLEWNLLEYEPHSGIQKLVRGLNNLYKEQPALHQKNFEDEGFEWIDFMDHEQSILAFLRKGNHRKNDLLVLCNFTEIPRKDYQVGVPKAYAWKEIFNTDDKHFGGSGVLNKRQIKPKKEEKHGKNYSIRLTIPPLGMTVFEQVAKSGK
jgi:1,4-alpha-glucan branching enzyme